MTLHEGHKRFNILNILYYLHNLDILLFISCRLRKSLLTRHRDLKNKLDTCQDQCKLRIDKGIISTSHYYYNKIPSKSYMYFDLHSLYKHYHMLDNCIHSKNIQLDMKNIQFEMNIRCIHLSMVDNIEWNYQFYRSHSCRCHNCHYQNMQNIHQSIMCMIIEFHQSNIQYYRLNKCYYYYNLSSFSCIDHKGVQMSLSDSIHLNIECN